MQSKQFYHFVIPSILSSLVTGLYFVVDGIFVGRGVGTQALASINIAVPFISLLTSVSMMIAIGGGTLAAICFGRGENARANGIFRQSMVLMLFFAGLMTMISVIFPSQLARMLGASEALLSMTADYLKFYVLFGVFFCGAMVLAAFVRNDGNPRLASTGMIVGALSNVVLDWLFIFPMQMGVVGAAVASGLGQVLSCAVLATHFLGHRGDLRIGRVALRGRDLLAIMRTGTPEFVNQMSQPVTILCYNYLVIAMLGEIGVAAFSVISYLLVIIVAVFIGLAEGMQPLLSRSFGAGDARSERIILRKGLRLGVALAVAAYALMWGFGRQIIGIFNSDPTMIAIAYDCIKIYGLCFIFAAANIVYTINFLATQRTAQALVIASLRSFVCNVLFILVMPQLFGEGALWTGMIACEAVVLMVAIALTRRQEALRSMPALGHRALGD
ncbi:MAG: MATE family efflux transporter [Peptococcaceae bacterium]|nr:MATE family efflux transporter [Peptococcaceae bacterium]